MNVLTLRSPIYWIVAHSSDPYPISRNLGGVIARWVYDVWIYRVLMSIVVGAIIGYVARKALRYAENRKWLDGWSISHRPNTFSLCYRGKLSLIRDRPRFLLLGLHGPGRCRCFLCHTNAHTKVQMGTDDLLGAFIAGNVFSWDDRQRQLHEDESIHDILDTLINAAVFIYMYVRPQYGRPTSPFACIITISDVKPSSSGATIPFDLFGYGALNIGPRRLVALAACIVFFRRLPWVTLMHWVIPALRNWRHGFFVGW
jgi:NhaP-type Na+/H+ or K+/H+ antiporter